MTGRSQSGRGDNGPGWIATVLGMVVLVTAGFIVGLIVGVISEEPTLVVGHLVGHDEELAWSPDAEPVMTEPEGVEPTLDWRQTFSESDRRSVSAPDTQTWEELPAQLPEVSTPEEAFAAASAGGFVVQVGAFSDSASAEGVVRALAAKGHAAYVTPSSGSGNRRWRVRVGPVVSREQAQQLARRLKLEERLPTWVVSQEGE